MLREVLAGILATEQAYEWDPVRSVKLYWFTPAEDQTSKPLQIRFAITQKMTRGKTYLPGEQMQIPSSNTTLRFSS